MKSNLTFNQTRDTGKTKSWRVGNGSGMTLGRISWNAGWRRYCFFPGMDTLYDGSCLLEICEFMEREMAVRKGAGVETVA